MCRKPPPPRDRSRPLASPVRTSGGRKSVQVYARRRHQSSAFSGTHAPI
jgi:hypothetical protein